MKRTCVILLLLAVAAPAYAQPLVFTGNGDGVWALRNTPGKTFDVASRAKGGSWQTVSLERMGQVMAAAAIDEQLHVLLREPDSYMIFRGDNSPPNLGLNPNDPRWPSGAAVVAAAEAVNFGLAKTPSLLAIVARPGGPLALPTQPIAGSQPAASGPASLPTTYNTLRLGRRDLFAPATAPATAPASASAPATASAPAVGLAEGIYSLAVFQSVNGRWQHLTEINDVPMTPNRRVLAAVANGTLYVLLCSDGGQTARLLSLGGPDWEELAIPQDLQRGDVAAMLVVQGRLVIVQGVPDEPGMTGLSLLTMDGGRRLAAVQRVRNGASIARWAQAQPPQAARLGEQIALLWPSGGQMRMATCDLTGQLVGETPVELFRPDTGNGQGAEIVELFLMAVLVAIIMLTFVLRPQGGAKPFELPPTLRTASPLKRLAAAAVDLLPIAAGAGWFFGITPEEFMKAMDVSGDYHISDDFASALIVLLTTYVGYCTVAEWRTGMTLGKKLFRLRVVGDEGRPPRLSQAALRNIVKIVEFLWPLRVPVLLLLPLFTRNRQRLGDMFARTTVVQLPKTGA